MTYVICKHKKTGSERIFTEPVFRANEHQYKFVAYTDNPNGKKKAVASEKVPVAKILNEALDKGLSTLNKQVVAGNADVADSVLSDLRTQYKAIAGKEAKKNWGVPRLTEEIKKAENQG